MRMINTILIAVACLAALPARAQIPGQDPDWPCAQRLVQTLSAGSYWTGDIPLKTAWRDDDVLLPLVTFIVDRDTPEADGVAKLRSYLNSPGATPRPALFSAIVDQTNDERSRLISRLIQLGRRQRGMGEKIASLSTTIDTTPMTDPRHDELAGERDFDVRAFQETQRTMRYACEAPANMDRRLGIYARLLQSK